MVENQRQLQKEKTRKKIIDVALIEFSKTGLITTRTSDIAKAANVSHGTIFAHFQNKEILIDTVVKEFGTRLHIKFDELFTSNCTIEEILKAHLLGLSEYENFYTKLILENYYLSENSQHLILFLNSTVGFYIEKVLEKEIYKKRFKNLKFSFIFNSWLGLINHYLINRDLFKNTGNFYEDHGQTLIENFLKLLEN